MSADLTPEVVDRLNSDGYGWLTTVAKSGQPVPKLVWFYFDGAALFVYSVPTAAKVAHVRRHPQVSVNADSDGNGGGIIVIGGGGAGRAAGGGCPGGETYLGEYREPAAQFGLTEAMSNYSTRIRIGVDKVWTTPTE